VLAARPVTLAHTVEAMCAASGRGVVLLVDDIDTVVLGPGVCFFGEAFGDSIAHGSCPMCMCVGAIESDAAYLDACGSDQGPAAVAARAALVRVLLTHPAVTPVTTVARVENLSWSRGLLGRLPVEINSSEEDGVLVIAMPLPSLDNNPGGDATLEADMAGIVHRLAPGAEISNGGDPISTMLQHVLPALDEQYGEVLTFSVMHAAVRGAPAIAAAAAVLATASASADDDPADWWAGGGDSRAQHSELPCHPRAAEDAAQVLARVHALVRDLSPTIFHDPDTTLFAQLSLRHARLVEAVEERYFHLDRVSPRAMAAAARFFLEDWRGVDHSMCEARWLDEMLFWLRTATAATATATASGSAAGGVGRGDSGAITGSSGGASGKLRPGHRLRELVAVVSVPPGRDRDDDVVQCDGPGATVIVHPPTGGVSVWNCAAVIDVDITTQQRT
jgi:hypothetical protein